MACMEYLVRLTRDPASGNLGAVSIPTGRVKL